MRNLYLCGFQGSGKTFFGQAVAQLLECPFFDIDHCLLEESQAISIRDLYLQIGEASFRNQEIAMLEQLSKSQNSIIALGGGSFIHPQAAIFTQNGQVLYLHKPFAILKRELEQRALPAYLMSYAAFDEVFMERHIVFCQLADAIIEIEERTNQQIIEEIAGHVK